VTAPAIDPDKPCPHRRFAAEVDVNRLNATENGPAGAFTADIRIRCADCNERFRFVGVQAGLRPDRPMVSVDEYELHAPIRPASADPDFGLGIPGFAVRYRDGPVILICLDCGLPDLHNGEGDGIGSCECIRCERCGGNRGDCSPVCYDDPYAYGADDEEYEPLDHPARQPMVTVELPAGDAR
jgi:hypothetical protein